MILSKCSLVPPDEIREVILDSALSKTRITGTPFSFPGTGLQFWPVKPKKSSSRVFLRKVSLLLRKRHQRKCSFFFPDTATLFTTRSSDFQKTAQREHRGRSWIFMKLGSSDWGRPYLCTCYVRW